MIDPIRPPRSDTSESVETAAYASDWFVRLLAGAVIAHIVGNPPMGLDALGITTLVLGLTASVALVVPHVRALRIVLCILVLSSVWLEAPFVGNHWVLTGFVALAVLAASFRSDWWRSFVPTGRGILLAFYVFAGFAKLNQGFLDPVASCALLFTNQSLASWGLAQIPSGGVQAAALAVATLVVELSIPILLVVRRTRPYGVMLGFVFHMLISFDRAQHFFDFTAILFALFSLFIDDGITARWEQTLRRHRPALVMLGVASAVLTWSAVIEPTSLTIWAVRAGVFLVWIPVAALLTTAVVRMPTGPSRTRVLRAPDAIGIALIALVVLNGLTPYLGLKTGYGINMYANLHTAEGESNHYLIRRTANLIDVPLVSILETSDPELTAYIDSGYLVPERNLLNHLADRPEATITYVVDGQTVSGSGSELGRPLPILIEKFGLFRSVDSQVPPRCQAVWLPAN